MNDAKLFFKINPAGWMSGAALLVSLTGCIGYVDRPAPQAEYVAPPPVQTTVLVEDDYVYYPGYQVYYSSNRRQYVYLEGSTWVSRPAPRNVSAQVLFASPSVRMDFHNPPASHHAAMVRQYPKNWTPPGPNHGHDQNHPGDWHDEHGNNH